VIQAPLFPLVFTPRDVLPLIGPIKRSVTAEEAIRALTTRNPKDLFFMGPTWSNEARMGCLICRSCGKDALYALATSWVTCPRCGVAHMEVVGSL